MPHNPLPPVSTPKNDQGNGMSNTSPPNGGTLTARSFLALLTSLHHHELDLPIQPCPRCTLNNHCTGGFATITTSKIVIHFRPIP